MISRRDLAVAKAAQGTAIVGAGAWLWLMMPLLGPAIMAGQLFAEFALAGPLVVGMLAADRVVALRLDRPGSRWKRFEQWRVKPPLCAVCQEPLPRDWATSEEVIYVSDDKPELGLMHVECPDEEDDRG